MDSTLVAALQREIERQDEEFIKRLNATGNADLAKHYRFIASLRETVSMADQMKWKNVSESPESGVSVAVLTKSEHQPVEAFVLRAAVRKQVAQLGTRRFRTRDIYNALHKQYPDYVGENKKSSVSATLANLTTMGEITKTVDAQRKVWFRAAEQVSS